MRPLIYSLIIIILIMISVFIVFVIYRKDIFAKAYQGFTRVGHKEFTREIDIKVTEDDLRRARMSLMAEEEEDESDFCKEMDACKKYCKGEVCNAFRDQKITYDYCLDCEEKGMCWSVTSLTRSKSKLAVAWVRFPTTKARTSRQTGAKATQTQASP